MQALGVVPVHPAEGGELDLFDGLRGPAAGWAADQLLRTLECFLERDWLVAQPACRAFRLRAADATAAARAIAEHGDRGRSLALDAEASGLAS